MPHLPEPFTRVHDLATVAAAISRATPRDTPIYVERRGDTYRWSPTHRGGPYPLLRETAQLLGVDYHELVVPVRPLEDTPYAIVDIEPPDGAPDAWTLLDLPQATDAESVAHRIRSALND